MININLGTQIHNWYRQYLTAWRIVACDQWYPYAYACTMCRVILYKAIYYIICPPYTLQWCMVYAVQWCTVYSVQCTLYIMHCIQCTLFTVHCTICSVQCKLWYYDLVQGYTLHSMNTVLNTRVCDVQRLRTMYTVHCALYTVHMLCTRVSIT